MPGTVCKSMMRILCMLISFSAMCVSHFAVAGSSYKLESNYSPDVKKLNIVNAICEPNVPFIPNSDGLSFKGIKGMKEDSDKGERHYLFVLTKQSYKKDNSVVMAKKPKLCMLPFQADLEKTKTKLGDNLKGIVPASQKDNTVMFDLKSFPFTEVVAAGEIWLNKDSQLNKVSNDSGDFKLSYIPPTATDSAPACTKFLQGIHAVSAYLNAEIKKQAAEKTVIVSPSYPNIKKSFATFAYKPNGAKFDSNPAEGIDAVDTDNGVCD